MKKTETWEVEIKREYHRGVPISNIVEADWNTSEDMEKEQPDAYLALCDSIEKFGVARPLLVREIERDGKRLYECIDGNSTRRAAARLGLKFLDLYNYGPLPDELAFALYNHLKFISGDINVDAQKELEKELRRRIGIKDVQRYYPKTYKFLVGVNETEREKIKRDLRENVQKLSEKIIEKVKAKGAAKKQRSPIQYTSQASVRHVELKTTQRNSQALAIQLSKFAHHVRQTAKAPHLLDGDAVFIGIRYALMTALFDNVDDALMKQLVEEAAIK